MLRSALVVLDPRRPEEPSRTAAMRLAVEHSVQLTALAAPTEGGWKMSGLHWNPRTAPEQPSVNAERSLDEFLDACVRTSISCTSLMVDTEDLEAVVERALACDLVLLSRSMLQTPDRLSTLGRAFMKEAHRPVLLLADGSPAVLGRVMVGLDNHAASWRAFHQFLLMMSTGLVESLSLVSLYQRRGDADVCNQRLKLAMAHARSFGHLPKTLSQEGESARVLPELARALKAQTVVLAPHHRNPMQRLFLGSVTEGFLAQGVYNLLLSS